MTILITNPNYDEATGYLFYYTHKLVEFAENSGLEVIYLKKPRLTKAEVDSCIKKKNPSLILFNGHGDEEVIYGDKIDGVEEPIVKKGENHEILADRLVYARACSAGASLERVCTGGRGCFIGYITPFKFWTDRNWSGNPAKDKLAELFLEPSNLLAQALLKGNTAKEADSRFREASKKNILRLLMRKEPGDMASIMILWDNLNGQVILGNCELRHGY